MGILVKAKGAALAGAEGVFGPVIFKTIGITEDGVNDCRSLMLR